MYMLAHTGMKFQQFFIIEVRTSFRPIDCLNTIFYKLFEKDYFHQYKNNLHIFDSVILFKNSSMHYRYWEF